ncbi:hypothetical protein E0Z10_g1159 [Xylaria hypoxylon]|uniref:Protein Asterix n=1 Tax=Xylaria hypoxylon TaxID=37992 RepID=A0A4Z0YTG7_9PEZI|nr:hypothetical protein E0Z10_g1159 [Xylaria hypoxylon]
MASKKDMRRPDLGKTAKPLVHRICASHRIALRAPERETPAIQYKTRQDKANKIRPAQTVVPYQEPPAGKSGESPEFSSTLSSTMPMAAIFTRNKYIGWAAVVFSMQSWLGESEATSQNSSTPGYFSVGMSVLALLVTYLPIFMPPVPGQVQPPAPAAA